MRPLLKAARRPVAPEWEQFGLGRDGWHQLDLVVKTLVGHVYFEHLGREKVRDALLEAVLRYRVITQSGRSVSRQEFAAETLDAMALDPLRGTVYLGVKHLQLPHDTVVGGVRFIEASSDPKLRESFAHLGEPAPSLLCEVAVTAGTTDLLRDRARDRAETALGLVRQQNLFGFPAKILLEQVLYRLDGTWTWRDGSDFVSTGWWREKPRPIPMDLAHPNCDEWRAKLTALSDLYSEVPPSLRSRVDTCIDWLDVAALSERWRIIIPAIFSGMEALLVPETTGLKAEIVTVRSVAVHAALNHEFFDPAEIMAAYRLRNDLIHGNQPEIHEKDATDFAESRRLWAFRVFYDYLELVKTIDATSVRDIVKHLDDGKCNDVCMWLEEHGGDKVVAAYRKIIRAPSKSPDEANSAR